jgi:hypothetical protein
MSTHLCSEAAGSSSAHRFDGAVPVIPADQVKAGGTLSGPRRMAHEVGIKMDHKSEPIGG